jgi:anti-sigma B factor antagonist
MPPKPFTLTEESSLLAHLIAVSGELDVSTSPKLRTAIAQAQAAGHERIVVDLSETEFVDSTGLSTLLVALRRITRADGRLALVCPPGPALKALKLTRLIETFPMFVSREAAWSSLALDVDPSLAAA